MSLKIGITILQRAVELDIKKRFTEALVCYQEGLQVLFNVLKESTGDQKIVLRDKVEHYMNRAEEIKRIIATTKSDGTFHEQIHIENDSTGHSYDSVFGRFFDGDVTSVKIEDPYIRAYHQCENLVRFCELLVKKCGKVNSVLLLTTTHGLEQDAWLQNLKTSLLQHKVDFTVTYSQTLHDRQITLNTGWIIKIGRGLDYFKPFENKFSLGRFDLDLRRCHETTVDIFHSYTVQTS